MSPSTLITPNRSVRKILFALILTLVYATLVYAQTTAFTYQGRLTDGGTPADGPYDMQFKLTDPNGNQFGPTATLNGVPITNGVFTVLLDFGNQFPGDDRRLEIGIKPAGSADPYTILLPRQPITSAPYAIRAGNAAQLGGVAADQYALTNDTRFDVNPNFIRNSNGQQAANFNINGRGRATKFAATQYEDVNGQRVLAASANRTTYVGLFAGDLDTQGNDNTYVGHSAGRKNINGFLNTYVGFSAGFEALGVANSVVGALAGEALQTGNNNTFVGAFAGRSVVNGIENTFVGAGAGGGANSARNSFFGVSSGIVTTGAENSFFGNASGFRNTLGHNNAFFGYLSGLENKIGSNNSFFGNKSGLSNEAGENNSFFGHRAGESNKTSTNNSYFGANAGVNSTGAFNAFFGSSSGASNIDGSNNSFFGSLAGSANISAFANSFFGSNAGIHNQDGSSNAFFGRLAGGSNISGNNNTIIGTFADVGSGGLSFATAIGSNAKVSTSNTIVLGRNNGSDTVQIPGLLNVSTLGLAGVTNVCRNGFQQLSLCSSSLRYKTNIAPFTRGLALLDKLKPITFNWRAGNSADLGFGAEDVAAVEPLLVTHNPDGEVEGVKYDRITAVLVNAVKEQQEQIKLQQQQIDALKRLVCANRRNVGVCK